MFLINSCYPHFCATYIWLPKHRSSFSRSYRGILPSSFSIVLSSALVSSTYPPVSVSGTVYDEAISWNNFTAYPIHIRIDNLRHPSHLIWSRNINLVPIDYDFRPRLRSRLNLRGLALRRNPWIFGDRVSHSVCRYSCQHSHFRYLHGSSRIPLHGLTERSATACTKWCTPAASVYCLAPLHLRRRITYLDQ